MPAHFTLDHIQVVHLRQPLPETTVELSSGMEHNTGQLVQAGHEVKRKILKALNGCGISISARCIVHVVQLVVSFGFIWERGSGMVGNFDAFVREHDDALCFNFRQTTSLDKGLSLRLHVFCLYQGQVGQ